MGNQLRVLRRNLVRHWHGEDRLCVVVAQLLPRVEKDIRLGHQLRPQVGYQRPRLHPPAASSAAASGGAIRRGRLHLPLRLFDELGNLLPREQVLHQAHDASEERHVLPITDRRQGTCERIQWRNVRQAQAQMVEVHDQIQQKSAPDGIAMAVLKALQHRRSGLRREVFVAVDGRLQRLEGMPHVQRPPSLVLRDAA
eukprot:scaffold8283_cov258-Pinguiococcus_pyrenoidosus.AAC.1